MLLRSLAAIAAVSLITLTTVPTPAWAQGDGEEGRGRGRGGERGGPGGERGGPGGRFGGGPGGPGGMMGGMMGGMGRGGDMLLLQLLQAEQVQTEIELMPDQKESLVKLAERQRGERPQFNFREASDEERQKYFENMQAEMAKRAAEAKDQLEEILLPAQFERLEQIAVQARGIMGLTNPETAKKLNLTTEQTEKLRSEMQSFGETTRERLGEVFRSGDREAARTKMEEIRKELETKLLAVLDENQKAEFEKMKGEPFEMPAMGGRGPGGPGGPGGERTRGGERGGERTRGEDGGRPAAE
jgi:hypothetical protein